jgi:hypothetical protein
MFYREYARRFKHPYNYYFLSNDSIGFNFIYLEKLLTFDKLTVLEFYNIQS